MTSPEPETQFTVFKMLISLFVVFPLTMVIAVLFFVAIWIGMGSPPYGFLLLGLAALGCLYIYSLVVSLWWDRRDAHIVFGLLAGSILAGIWAYSSLHDAVIKLSSGSVWTLQNLVDQHGLACLAFLNILLSLYLLFRRLPAVSPYRSHDTPRAPILVAHNGIPQGTVDPPKRGPYLPTKDETPQ